MQKLIGGFGGRYSQFALLCQFPKRGGITFDSCSIQVVGLHVLNHPHSVFNRPRKLGRSRGKGISCYSAFRALVGRRSSFPHSLDILNGHGIRALVLLNGKRPVESFLIPHLVKTKLSR